MSNNLEEHFFNNLKKALSEKKIPLKYYSILLDFYNCYIKALIDADIDYEKYVPLFEKLLILLENQVKNPYVFQPFHQKITSPFNYHEFGLELLMPLVDLQSSSIQGLENVDVMQRYIEQKENVILLANHQTEVDPHLINIFLNNTHPSIASDVIFVAGERVITDPIAIPFSMGCNLLCIYSKKYIDIKPELKHQKQMHNRKTMSLMSKLLSEGGKIIYVAPSGGRDRKNIDNKIEIAPFDPQSLEMFYLMTKKAKRASHFFPLALATYDLFPPPQTTQIEMGEKRTAKRIPVHLSFGREINMEHFDGSDTKDKILKRKNRAKYIHNLVKRDYQIITGE